MATIGIVFFNMSIDAFEEVTDVRMLEETNNYKKRLHKQVKKDYQILNTFASIIGDTRLLKETNYKDLLKDVYQENEFLTIGYFDIENKGIIISDGGKVNTDYSIDYLQVEVKNVVEKALKGEENLSESFFGTLSQQKVFIMGIPVLENGKIKGAIIGSSAFDIYSDIISEERILEGNAYIHLIDDKGNFIIRSPFAAVKNQKKGIFEEPYLAGDELTRIQNAMKDSKNAHFTFQYEGVQYHAILDPLEINDWYLFCVNSVENSNKDFYSIALAAAIFFVMIVLLFVFVLTYGYRVMKKGNQQLTYFAYFDHLTGIYNLNYFREMVLKKSIKQPNYTIVVFNILKFKFVNEIFGKEQADYFLCHIARILQESINDDEIVCHDHADIFYMYLLDTDMDVLKQRITHMIDSIELSLGKFNNNQYKIIMSCGVASNTRLQSLQTVMNQAMFALETSKKNVNNPIWFFDINLHEKEKMRHYIEGHMYKALENNEFKVYLQPKINLLDNTLSGAEALVRWIKEDGTIIYPNQFIPIFEHNGFCVHLDMYMFEKVCQLLRQWIDKGYPVVPISINQSKLVFYELDYVKNVEMLLKKYDIPPSLIVLEILEEMSIANIDALNKKIDELKNLGLKISMDDFGVGYTSLSTLGKLHIDELKLDRHFLLEIDDPNNKNATLIMEQIIQLTKKLSIQSVVEGVETLENDLFIKKIGCDFGQGYYYSKPIDSNEFKDKILLKKNKE